MDIIDEIMFKSNEDISYEDLKDATKEELELLLDYVKRGDKHIEGYVDYDIRFMRLAREVSTWSKDPSSKLGAVAVSKNNGIVLSQGYNGFPRGIDDNHRLYIKKVKYQHIVHAEMNCIYNAANNGVLLRDSTLYVYGLPVCSNCALGIIQSGIRRVVMCATKDDQRWIDSFQITKHMFDESNIEYSFIDKSRLGA